MTRDIGLLKGKRGFTLLEVLIVIVILGVVAGLAIPIYSSQIERARGQEALMNLGALREAAQRYYSSNNSYTSMSVRVFNIPQASTDLDIDPNNPAGGVTNIFTYTVAVSSSTAYILTATRRTGLGTPPDPPAGTNTITINQAGAIVRSGAYA